MDTQLLSGDDIRYLAQQNDDDVSIMVGQMTTIMENITSLQEDIDDKVKQMENQGWFKRMCMTVCGKNKATKQEIQRNNDKVVTYISQSLSQLYQMNMINERVICSLGNRMNEVYAQVVQQNQEVLNMKGQISDIMVIQQQTIEQMDKFVTALNEKIESVDNFHMLLQEVQSGMYNDNNRLYSICSILAQLDKRQMDDSRKMNLLSDAMRKTDIINDNEFTVFQCLQEIVELPIEKIGLIYTELCNFRNSFPANMFADMIESYHFLSKMEKMSKKKELIIQRVLDKYELDADACFSIELISESFFENKQTSLISFEQMQQLKMEQEQNYEVVEDTEKEKKEDEEMSLSDWENIAYALYYGPEHEDFGVEGIEQDYDKAAELFEKLAEEGMVYSQYMFAEMCENGEGVQKNSQRAVKWYRKAAEQGNGMAQLSLGAMYYSGNGVNQDYSEAYKWTKKAAEQDNALANYNLGFMFQEGYGVQEDYSMAIQYYKKAAELGNEDALEKLIICPNCGDFHVSTNINSHEKRSFGKGALLGGGGAALGDIALGALLGPIGLVAGAAVGAYAAYKSSENDTVTLENTCQCCGHYWEEDV